MEDKGELVPELSYGTHVELMCMNHPHLTWSTKNIHGRSIFFAGMWGREVVKFGDKEFLATECSCSTSWLKPTGRHGYSGTTKSEGDAIIAAINASPVLVKMYQELMLSTREAYLIWHKQQNQKSWTSKPINSQRIVLLRNIQRQLSAKPEEGKNPILGGLIEFFQCYYLDEVVDKLKKDPAEYNKQIAFALSMDNITKSEVKELAKVIKHFNVKLTKVSSYEYKMKYSV